MSEKTTKIYTCDKCGTEYRDNNEVIKIYVYSLRRDVDICHNCVQEIVNDLFYKRPAS